MRACLSAALLLLPVLARAGAVTQIGPRGLPVTGGAGAVKLGGMKLSPDAKFLQGVMNLNGNTTLTPDQMRAPIVNFVPNMDVPALPRSAVGQAEAGQYFETAAFGDLQQPLKLQRMVPPGNMNVVGDTFTPLREQSQSMASKQAVVASEIDAASEAGAGDAEGALAFGDRIWDVLLGGKNVGRSGSDWRPVSNGFTNLTSGRSTGGGSSSVEGGVSASPSENGITLTLSAARGEGVGAVETLSALPSFMPLPVSVITTPSAGISTPGAAKAVRVLPIPRIMLRVYNGAMSLAYNTVPGHAFSTQVSYSAVSGLVKTQAVQVETRTPVFTKPTTSSLPAFTGLTFTQATAAMPKAEAERFSYLQTAGQAFPALTYSLSAPSSFSGGREAPSSPVSSLPLWVFPLSAVMPLLAMGLLVRQD